jgi:pimeloyl-ACP methyl ester carboxylesterase
VSETSTVAAADGTELQYDIVGSGQLRFAFINPRFADSQYWMPVADLVTRGQKAILVAGRGTGTAGASAEPAPLVEDLSSVLSDIGARAATIVAEHADADVALAARLYAPERVGGAVLLNPTITEYIDPRSEARKPHVISAWEADQAARTETATIVDELTLEAMLLARSGEDGRSQVRLAVLAESEMLADTSVERMTGMIWGHLVAQPQWQAVTRPEVASRLSDIAMPVTLVLTGDASEVVKLTVDELSRALPRATIRRLVGQTPSLVALEGPDELAAILRATT